MTDGNQCLDTDPADVESALLAVEAEMESSTTTNQGNGGDNGGPTQDDHSPPFSLSEIMGAFARGADGDADLMIELLRGEYVYDHVENAHFRFKEHIWVPDESEQIICEVRDKIIPCYAYAADTMATEAAQNSETEVKEYYKSKEEHIRRHILQLHSLHKKKEIVQLACTGDNSLAIKNASWDQHPFKFPFQNGVLDLQDASFRPGRPTDYIRTCCNTVWNGLDAPATRWENCLLETFNKSHSLVSFLQRVLGYALIGKVIERNLFVFYGAVQNGKGTILETLIKRLIIVAMEK